MLKTDYLLEEIGKSEDSGSRENISRCLVAIVERLDTLIEFEQAKADSADVDSVREVFRGAGV